MGSEVCQNYLKEINIERKENMPTLTKLYYLFFSPVNLFKRIKERGGWFFPFFLLILLSLITSYLLLPDVIIPEQIETIREDEELQPDDREMRIEYFKSTYHLLSSYFSRAGGYVFSYLIIAFLLTVVIIPFGGQSIGYGKAFSAAAYIAIIRGIVSVVESFIILQSGNLDFGFNLAMVISEIEGYLYYLFRNINFFNIWQVILFAICLQVFYKYSKKKAYLLMFSAWGLWVLISSYFNYLRSLY